MTSTPRPLLARVDLLTDDGEVAGLADHLDAGLIHLIASCREAMRSLRQIWEENRGVEPQGAEREALLQELLALMNKAEEIRLEIAEMPVMTRDGAVALMEWALEDLADDKVAGWSGCRLAMAALRAALATEDLTREA